MKTKKIRWNPKKEANHVSTDFIRKMNDFLRKLQSPYQKDKTDFSKELTNMYKQLADKPENRRVLTKFLKKRNLLISFRQLIDVPNNLYKEYLN